MENIDQIIGDTIEELGLHFDDRPQVECHDRRPGRFPQPMDGDETAKVYPVEVADIAPQEQTEEIFSNQIVRMYVAKIYGKMPTGKTYGNWRKKAGCDRKEGVTLEQALRLIAIAELKKRQLGKRHTEKQIDGKVNRKGFRNEVLAFLRTAEAEMVLGRQIKGLLYLRGISATSAEIKQLIPGFSANKRYNFGMVMLALTYARKFA